MLINVKINQRNVHSTVWKYVYKFIWWPFGFHRSGEFLVHLSNYQFFMEYIVHYLCIHRACLSVTWYWNNRAILYIHFHGLTSNPVQNMKINSGMDYGVIIHWVVLSPWETYSCWVAHQSKKFSAFYGTWMFLTYHPFQYPLSISVFLVVLSFGSSHQKLYSLLFSSMFAMFPDHLLHDLIILIMFGEEYKFWSSSLCIFLQPLIILSIIGPNIIVTTQVSNTLSLGT